MTVYKKIFLDTAPIVYLLDENDLYAAKMTLWMDSRIESAFVSSPITVMEYLVYPYRMNNNAAVNDFFTFLSSYKVDILPIDRSVAENAAKLRGKYRHFKALDALQLSAAMLSGCDAFLTNDRQLRQCRELAVVQVDELPVS